MGRLAPETIRQMELKNAPAADLKHAKESMKSMHALDVVRHRGYIKQYNPTDPWRNPNNFVFHPMDYQFGGPRAPVGSPEALRDQAYINMMLGQHVAECGPIPMAGGHIDMPAGLDRHFQFGALSHAPTNAMEYSDASQAAHLAAMQNGTSPRYEMHMTAADAVRAMEYPDRPGVLDFSWLT
jgi:hypothetical protein